MAKPENKKDKSLIELLTEDAKSREENCIKAVNDALKQYNCEIQAAVLVAANGNFPQIKIVAKPAQN